MFSLRATSNSQKKWTLGFCSPPRLGGSSIFWCYTRTVSFSSESLPDTRERENLERQKNCHFMSFWLMGRCIHQGLSRGKKNWDNNRLNTRWQIRKWHDRSWSLEELVQIKQNRPQISTINVKLFVVAHFQHVPPWQDPKIPRPSSSARTTSPPMAISILRHTWRNWGDPKSHHFMWRKTDDVTLNVKTLRGCRYFILSPEDLQMMVI